MTLCSPVVSGRQKSGSGSSALSKKSPWIAAVAVARKALNIKVHPSLHLLHPSLEMMAGLPGPFEVLASALDHVERELNRNGSGSV